MRIGIELKHLDPSRGGAEACSLRFAQWLIKSGHEVHLFAQQGGSFPSGALIHRDGPMSADGLRRTVRSARLDLFIGTDKAEEMDVFHPHKGTVRGNLEQEISRIPNNVIRGLVRGASLINPVYRRSITREQTQVGDDQSGPAIIAVSDMIAREFRSRYRIRGDRIRVIRNGVDCEWFSDEYTRNNRKKERDRLGITDREICFLTVANDPARKGVAELLRATAALQREGISIRAVVVGRSNPRSARRLAHRLGCGQSVSFLPAMSDIRNAYAAADVFVLPTWYDPCSLTVLEAMASGLPVVTTWCNGASELVEDGREGFVIDSPADLKGLLSRMRDLYDTERRSRMGVAARARAMKHTQEDNFRAVFSVLTDCLKGPPTPAM